jgi:hypothetical protein
MRLTTVLSLPPVRCDLIGLIRKLDRHGIIVVMKTKKNPAEAGL